MQWLKVLPEAMQAIHKSSYLYDIAMTTHVHTGMKVNDIDSSGYKGEIDQHKV